MQQSSVIIFYRLSLQCSERCSRSTEPAR